MSTAIAEQVRHWLAVADDQDTEEKKLAARYTAGAAARLWVLDKLDSESDVPDAWGQVRDFASEADEYLDNDEQDEALYRRAQANVLALQLFEEAGESDHPDADDAHDEDADDADDADSDDDEDTDSDKTDSDKT
jgi:hypothetical protein